MGRDESHKRAVLGSLAWSAVVALIIFEAKWYKESLPQTLGIPSTVKVLLPKMNVTVSNNTPYPIVFAADGTYFGPGKYETEPMVPILPGQSTTYELVASNMGGGVNGGNAWVVQLDDDTTWTFASGWIAPVRGPKQAGVVESSNPQDGNKAATTEGNSITSADTYKDKDGQSIMFTASATPHEFLATVFVVGTVPV
ncbi:hypothetical protein M407DRAFT_22812 [Tulasnella calospora MUT 4182]|uniref:Uncharacterized protein n=1 Tax=Tulasnella calospora MUT 4182 TaxID=1051891 RepID=A0A0C3QM80_9AGAM|nr:hypothetical protein M407DRAFT_22812 [Tulasnella calospora MUT 4182]